MPHVNWDSNLDQSEIIADGKYLCRVVDVQVKPTKTGKEMWSVHLRIETEGDFYGKLLFRNLIFGDSSMWIVKQFYEAALEKPMSGESECRPDDLMDKFVFATVKGSKKYNDKPQPIIANIESSGDTEPDIPF